MRLSNLDVVTRCSNHFSIIGTPTEQFLHTYCHFFIATLTSASNLLSVYVLAALHDDLLRLRVVILSRCLLLGSGLLEDFTGAFKFALLRECSFSSMIWSCGHVITVDAATAYYICSGRRWLSQRVIVNWGCLGRKIVMLLWGGKRLGLIEVFTMQLVLFLLLLKLHGYVLAWNQHFVRTVLVLLRVVIAGIFMRASRFIPSRACLRGAQLSTTAFNRFKWGFFQVSLSRPYLLGLLVLVVRLTKAFLWARPFFHGLANFNRLALWGGLFLRYSVSRL